MIEVADDHYGLDVSRAEELIGWTPQGRLLDVLPTIIDGPEDPVALVLIAWGWFQTPRPGPGWAQNLMLTGCGLPGERACTEAAGTHRAFQCRGI